MAHVLSKLHDRAAVPAIATLLGDPDRQVRLKAAFALGQLGGDEAAAALLEVLGRGDEEERETVADALTRTGVDVLEPLLARISGGSPLVRAQVADALGHLVDARAIAGLATLAADPDGDVALSAVLALAGHGDDPAAHDALVVATGSSDPRVVLVAQRLLSS